MNLEGKKIGMVGVMNSPPMSIKSHNAGWTYIIMDQYGCEVLNEHDDWNKYDVLIVNEGTNYREGVYNVFGGVVSDKTMKKLEKIANFKGEMFAIGDPVDYKDFVTKRKLDVPYKDRLPRVESASPFESDTIIIGDSHTVASYRPKSEIIRRDGKTLGGALRKGMFETYVKPRHKHVIVNVGNIDLRHHWMREEDPVATVTAQVRELFDQLKELDVEKITVWELLAIDGTHRKTPKTIYFKGQPYYGTVEERQKLRDIFNDHISTFTIDDRFEIAKWPSHFEANGMLRDEVMEGSGSVHISPANYPHFKQDGSKVKKASRAPVGGTSVALF